MFQQTPTNPVLFKRTLITMLMGVFSMAAILYGGFVLTSGKAQAATNSTINFQARLEGAGGNIAPDGYYNIEFKLYSASSGGSALWTEDYYDANGVTAGQDNRVQVINGYVTINLGSQTAFPGTINWDQDLYLTMNVGGTTQTATPTYDGEMNPRLKLTGVPYAFRAGSLATFNSGTGFTSTLSILQPTGGNQTFQIADQGAAGTYTLLTQNTANTNYIQNQNASAQSSTNFWISGTGRADTSFLTPTVDVASAGTLSVGTSTATAISLGKAGVTTTNAGALTVTQLGTFNGGLTSAGNFNVTSAGYAAFQRGSDYSTTGTTNDVNFGTSSLVRLTGASAQTITGLANGADGRILTLVNAAAQAATIANASASSAAANRILTGTGGDISLPADASVTMIYDSSTSRWRVSSGAAAATGGYIQNQNAAVQSSSNFWISGTGRADTSFTTPLLDTATGVALGIGTTNATAINLNQNTTIAAGKTLTVTSALTSLTGATSGDALSVSNSTSTGNIAVFKDNATAVVSIADGGAVLFKNVANSTTAFQVQNATASATVFAVDTTNSLARILGTGTVGDVTLTSGTGALQIGADNSTNIAFDNNEIEARNNGATSTLFLQNDGGAVSIGAGGLTTAGAITTTAGGSAGTGTQTIASNLYVQSRGTNLVTNGTGLLGNNYNFSSFTFDPTYVYAGGGSFKNSTFNASVTSDELIPVDPSHTYQLNLSALSSVHAVGAHAYFGVTPYDIDGNVVAPQYYSKYVGSTDTTLAAQLNPGDSTMTLTSASGWSTDANGFSRNFIWYGYTNGQGYTYPDYTYSRTSSHTYSDFSSNGAWATSGISGNVITLRSTWAGPTLPAGTAIRNNTSGASFKYIAAANVDVPATWTQYSGRIGSIDTGGFMTTNQFPYGTANIKLLFLMNRDVAGNTTNVSGITFSDNSGVFNSTTTATVPVIIQGTTGQTADLLQLQDVSGTSLAKFTAAGALTAVGVNSGSGLIQGTGGATISGNISLGSVGASTSASAIHIADTSNASGIQAVTIGSTAANASNLTIIQGGSNTTSAIQLLPNTAGGIMIGAGAGTGTITLGQSTASNTINIGSAITASSNTQTINIANGAGAGTALNVNILSGVGTAGTAALLMANNTRVTQIDLGNIAPTAARTTTIAGGNSGVVDTINIGTGAGTVAGAKTIHIGDGTPTGSGSNLITIGSTALASATTIQAGSAGLALNGATSVSGANTFTSGTGTVLLQGNSDVANTVSLATKRGTSYTTTGSANDVAISTASLYVMDTSGSAQTITGIVAGRDGQHLTLVNGDTALAVTLTNDDAASTAANRIYTGTGGAVTIPAGASISLVYNTAASRWQVVGGTTGTSGNYIQNQNAGVQSSSNFWISGTGRADTSFLTPTLDTATAVALNIGTATATGVNIATNAAAHTIAIGNGAAVQGITIGSTNSTSSLLLQAGTGNLSIQTQGGTLGIGNNAVAQTLVIGNATGATSVAVDCGTGACSFGTTATAHTTTLGSTNSTSATTVQGGTNGVNIGTGGIANTIQIGNTTGAVSQSVNIGNNATASSTSNVNIGSSVAGTTAVTGPTTVTNRTSGSADTFNVSNSTSTGTIAKFLDNATTVFSLADGGAALFQNQGDSATAFQIQQADGDALFTVDTSGSGQIKLGTASDTTGVLSFLNSGGANAVTIKAGSGSAAIDFTLPTAVATTGDCVKVGTVSGASVPLTFAACGGAGSGGVTLQGSTPGTPDTGNINVSGTIIGGTALQTPLIDTPSGTTTLNIGTTNATSGINLNQNTTIATNKSLILTGGTSFPGSPVEGQVFYRSDTDQLYIYTGSRWQADRSTATKIVAANDSQNKEKADYVADGTADQVEINAAITALPATGGKVVLLDGTYNIAATININKNNVTLSGAGPSTILNKAWNQTSAGSGVINISNNYALISELQIFGNKGTYANVNNHGIYEGGSTHYSKINGIIVDDMAGYGIFMDGNSDNTHHHITNNQILDIGQDGLRLSGLLDSTVSHNTIGGSGAFGVYITGGGRVTVSDNFVGNNVGGISTSWNTVVSGNAIQNNTTGVGVYNAGTTVSGNMISNNADGIVINPGVDQTTISGNTIIDSSDDGIVSLSGSATEGINIDGNHLGSNAGNAIDLTSNVTNSIITSNRVDGNTGSSSESSIEVNDADGIDVVGNKITDTAGTGFAILIGSGAVGTYLADNTYSGTGAASISDAGTATKYANQLDSNGYLQNIAIGSTFKSTTNNTTAFQIQNSAGTNQVNVNTLTTGNNLWANPSFEQTIDGVVAHNSGQVSHDGVDVTAKFGIGSLKYIAASTNSGAEFRFPFKGSTTYALSVWIRKDAGSATNVNMGVAENGSDADCSTNLSLTTTWTQYTCSFTTGTTIGGTSNFYIKNNSVTPNTLYIDGVTLVLGSAAFNYALPGSALQVEPYYNQMVFNAGNNPELQPWQQNPNQLPAARSRAAVAAANGYVYVMGGGSGVDGATPQTSVYYAKANGDGTLGSWTTNANALGTAIAGAGGAIINGYIYVIGGATGAVGSTDSALVQYARINADGSIGTWGTTLSLPAVRDTPAVTNANGAIQVIGGNNSSTSLASTLYARPNLDGTISSWITGTTIYSGMEKTQASVSNGYVYLTGGSFSNGVTPTTVVQYAPLNSDGSMGSWNNSTSIPVGSGGNAAVALNNQLYEIGGSTASGDTSAVYISPILGNGSVGTWYTSTNPLPIVHATAARAGVQNHKAVTLNGYIYVIGGDDATAVNTKVFYTSGARVKINGSLDLTGGNSSLTDSNSGGQLTAGNTNVVGTLQVAADASFMRGVSVTGGLSVGGQTTLRNLTNSANAFQVQNSAGTAGINVNTLTTDLNLVTNGDFETGTANGWSLKGSAQNATPDQTFAKFGTYSLFVKTMAAADNGVQYKFGFKPSTQYSLSLWARRSASTDSNFNIGRSDNGSDTDCLTGQTFNTTWTQFNCTFTTGATIGAASSFYIKQTDSSNDDIYIDGVTLVAGATSLNYTTAATALQVEPYYANVSFNATNIGEVQPWQLNNNALTGLRSDSATTTANGFVYVIGGNDGSGLVTTNTVQYAKLNGDGSTGAFTNNTNNLNTNVAQASAVVANGYIYVIGGLGSGSTYQSVVQFARLNSDGSTGTWRTTTSIPTAMTESGVVTQNGFIYILGGITSGPTSNTITYYAKVNADGTVSRWTSGTTMVGGGGSGQGVIANGYIYKPYGTIGGHNGMNIAPINADGSIGTWDSTASGYTPVLPASLAQMAVVAMNNYIYVIGGNGTTPGYVNTVYYAPLNDNGSTGNWLTSTNPMPNVRTNIRAVTANGYIYIMGGSNATTRQSTVFYTSTSRLKVAGSLDLVGTSSKTLVNAGSAGQLTAGNGTFVGTLQVQGAANFSDAVSVAGSLNVAGQAAFQNTTNTATAFQIQNSAGAAQINVNNLTTDNNLWPNPNFESNVNGLAQHNTATITHDDVDVTAKYGRGTAKVALASVADYGVEFRYPFKGSTTYSISLWLRRDAGSVTNISIGRADNGSDTDCLASQTLNTTWTQFSCSFTTGTTIGSTSNFYIKNTNGVNGNTMYIDGVTLVASGTPLNYILPGSALQVEPYYNQVVFNAGNSAEIGPWRINANALPGARSQPAVATANGYVYVMGGGTGTAGGTPTNTVYYAKANADGSLGAWTTNANNLTQNTSNAAGVVVNGYIYVIGGTVSGADSALVQYARLNADGSTGTWGTTTVLPAARDGVMATTYAGAIQVIGGNTGAATIATTVYGKVNTDGTISSWTAGTSMTNVREKTQAVVSDGYVYVIGGNNGNGAGTSGVTESAPLNNDGSMGTWVRNSDLPASSHGNTAVAALNGNFYAIAGWDGTNSTTAIDYAERLATGANGAWTTSTNPLPIVHATASRAGVQQHRAVTLNGYIYVLGGDDGTAAVSKVYYNSGARVKINGSLDLTSGATDLTSPTTGGQLTAGNTNVVGTLQVAGDSNFLRNTNITGQLTVGGQTALRNLTNSATAFQVQTAAGANLVQVDSSNSNITLLGNNAGEPQPWTTAANSLTAVRDDVSGIAYGGYLYVPGGIDASTVISTVNYAKIGSNGAPGTWGTTSSGMTGVHFHGTTTANGYLYVLGGFTNTGGTTSTAAVQYAKINPDGTLGAFTTTTALPAAIGAGKAVTYGGYIYYVGGNTGTMGTPTFSRNIYYAKANPDGTVGAWSTMSNAIPTDGKMYSGVTLANGYLYVVGGQNSGGNVSTVYYAKFDNDADGGLGALSTSANSIPQTERNMGLYVMNGYIYAVGGNTGSADDEVFYAALGSTGDVGAWSTAVTANKLPTIHSSMAYAQANGYIYSLGGYDGANPTTNVYYTSLTRLTVGGSLDLVGLSGENLAEGGSGGNLTAGNTQIAGTLQVNDAASLLSNLSVEGDLRVGAAALFKNRVNSTTAFQIQTAAGAALLTADTTNSQIVVTGDIYSKGTQWTIRTSAADNSWGAVTYGNGLFVAVAQSGTGNRVMTSPDGINWTIRTSAADNQWDAVTYGNGLFVAVAFSGTGNRVMTSPDGINWTIRTSAADNTWTGVTYGNGLFVAVSLSGSGNRVMTSPDGINWTIRTSAADNLWSGVTYGNGLFVAVAQTGSGNRVMTSPDGITWTIRTSAADNGWDAVTYGNGLFVAVAADGIGNGVMTSPDGITWTIRTSAADNSWAAVTYGNGLFVAVSLTGVGYHVMTSPDGITWTKRTIAADNFWSAVTYGNGLFVATATSGTGNRAMTSGHAELNALSANNTYQGGQTVYGSSLFKSDANSTTAFQIQTAAGANLFVADTSSAVPAIKIGGGDVSTNNTPTILVLDSKTGYTSGAQVGDPTGVAGAMYYNAAIGAFRCYLVDHWRDCMISARTSYNFTNEMFSTTYNDEMDFDNNGTAGNANPVTGETGHPGMMGLFTNASATAIQTFVPRTSAQKAIRLGNGDYWRAETDLKIPSASNGLSSGTQRYTVRAGLMDDGTTGDSTNGCYFRYTDNVNTGKWQGVCRSASTESTCDAGTTVAVDTWYRLTVSVNTAGDSVAFQVNGATSGTGYCTITTNIPIAVGRETNWGGGIYKSIGTTSRFIYVDYINVIGQFGTAR